VRGPGDSRDEGRPFVLEEEISVMILHIE